MKKIYVGVFAVVSLVLSAGAAAQVTGSAGYSNFDFDGVSLGAIQGTVGYRFPVMEGAGGTGYVIPELRLGFGINDDSFQGVKVELENYVGGAARFQYESHAGFYGFLQTSLVNYSLKASVEGFSVSDSETEFGIGLGGGMYFTETMGVELSYENVDDADVLNVSLRFEF